MERQRRCRIGPGLRGVARCLGWVRVARNSGGTVPSSGGGRDHRPHPPVVRGMNGGVWERHEPLGWGPLPRQI